METEKPKGAFIKFAGDKIVGAMKCDDGTNGILIQEAGINDQVKIGEDYKEMDGRYETPNEDGHHVLAFESPDSIDVVIEKLQIAKTYFA